MMLGLDLLPLAIAFSRLRIVVGGRQQAAHPRRAARTGTPLLIFGRRSCVFRAAHRIQSSAGMGMRPARVSSLSPGIVPGEFLVGITGTSLVSSGNGF